ncbi:MAG TPA: hypothetical protein VFU02_04945 [Polyangiaceae bacterium]|nr:hypothetical protein [Polyangiaceae bacterium]
MTRSITGVGIAGILACLATGPACKSGSGGTQAHESEAGTPDSGEVLLSGRFERVAKKVEGRVELVRKGDRYALRLLGARVDHPGEVHVYFVGLPSARSTLEMARTNMQYDFGKLEQGAPEQIIGLPSEPAPELRTVVLFEPRYRVNLAAAALEPVSTR